MKLIVFSYYALEEKSKTYGVVSNVKWFKQTAKIAGVNINVVDGRECPKVDAEGAIVVLPGIKSMASMKTMQSIDTFLTANKDTHFYLLCDDPKHLESAYDMKTGECCGKFTTSAGGATAVGFLNNSRDILHKMMNNNQITVLIPTTKFSAEHLCATPKRQAAFNGMRVVSLNLFHAQNRGTRHAMQSCGMNTLAFPHALKFKESTAVLATMRDYARKKAMATAEALNFSLVEYSKYTQKTSQSDVVNMASRARVIMLPTTQGFIASTGWLRYTHSMLYHFNALGVYAHPREAATFNALSWDDIIKNKTLDAAQIIMPALERQRDDLKRRDKVCDDTLQFIEKMFTEKYISL